MSKRLGSPSFLAHADRRARHNGRTPRSPVSPAPPRRSLSRRVLNRKRCIAEEADGTHASAIERLRRAGRGVRRVGSTMKKAENRDGWRAAAAATTPASPGTPRRAPPRVTPCRSSSATQRSAERLRRARRIPPSFASAMSRRARRNGVEKKWQCASLSAAMRHTETQKKTARPSTGSGTSASSKPSAEALYVR